MTLDCPFRNPLQSRVIPVLSYYLTSYGYLHFYWIRSAASPSNPPVLPRPSFLLPLLRPNSSYVRPLVGSLSCLPSGAAALRWLKPSCPAWSFWRHALFRIQKNPEAFVVSPWLPLMADAKFNIQMIFDPAHGCSCGGSA